MRKEGNHLNFRCQKQHIFHKEYWDSFCFAWSRVHHDPLQDKTQAIPQVGVFAFFLFYTLPFFFKQMQNKQKNLSTVQV